MNFGVLIVWTEESNNNPVGDWIKFSHLSVCLSIVCCNCIKWQTDIRAICSGMRGELTTKLPKSQGLQYRGPTQDLPEPLIICYLLFSAVSTERRERKRVLYMLTLLPSISYLEGICNFFAHHADDGDDDDGDDDGDGDDDACR